MSSTPRLRAMQFSTIPPSAGADFSLATRLIVAMPAVRRAEA